MHLPRLMLVTDRQATRGRDLVDVVAAAVDGGLGFVQVREKDLDAAAVRRLVERMRRRLPDSVVLAVNDLPILARDLGLGLHLPAGHSVADPTTLPFFGMSVHDESEAAAAVEAGVQYLVVGTIFPTASKPGHPGVGTGIIARLAGRTPIYAIGGVAAGKVPDVLAAGAYGVAVRSAILTAPDVTRATAALVAELG